VIPDLLNDRAKPGRTCPGRKKIERPQDGQTRFDQRIELLIQNKEIRTAYLSPGSAAKQTTDPPAARFNGVNKQTPFRELLAGFVKSVRSLDVREDTPVGIGHATNKFTHTLSVYLI